MDKATLIEKIKEIELNRHKAEQKAANEFYERNSPHFRDNKQYEWALQTINKTFDNELHKLLDYPVTNGRECPFCGELDFDEIGLKYHLRFCEKFEQTPNP